MPTKKLTQNEKAELYGVSRKTIVLWEKEGVNTERLQEVAKYLANLRKKPPNLTELVKNAINSYLLESQKVSVPVTNSEGDPDIAVVDLPKFSSLDEARMEQIRYKTALDIIKIRKEEGDLLSIDSLIEALQKIGASLKATLLKVPHDMAVALEGKTSREIEELLTQGMHKVLSQCVSDMEKLKNNE